MQGANLGGIENQTYYSMAGIIDRMDTYHEDYLYRPFEERRDADIINGRKPPNLSDGKEIEKGDWDSAILYFLSSDKFAELLEEITPENYDALFELSNEIKNNLPMGYTNEVNYMADKIIAESIIETQSAYVMAEKDNKVYLSNYGYGDGYYVKTIDEGWTEIPVSAKDAFWQDIIDKEWVYDENGISDWGEQVFTVHNNYNEIIEQEKSQILEDIKDIGIDNHYLNEYAFCYLGMEEEYCSAMNEKGIDEEDLDELDICD